jgi:hypothetical protein
VNKDLPGNLFQDGGKLGQGRGHQDAPGPTALEGRPMGKGQQQQVRKNSEAVYQRPFGKELIFYHLGKQRILTVELF